MFQYAELQFQEESSSDVLSNELLSSYILLENNELVHTIMVPNITI